jgi:Zn-finger nucleic acid-binding protein
VTTTGVVHCAECGGPNAANPNASKHQRCEFCRAPIATLRCAHCYQLNVPELDYCAGCGEVLGLLPISAPAEMMCPVCQVKCRSLDGDPGVFLECTECGGQFADHGVLRALLERRRRLARSYVPLARALELETKIQYRRCPICEQHMLRRNFGRTSGVIVDVCVKHGVWFDASELSRVLRFVEAGGIIDVRRRALGLDSPRSVDDERKQAALIAAEIDQRAKARNAGQILPVDPPSAFDVATIVIEGGVELLDVLVRFITED